MLDVADPTRASIIAQRQKVYQARRKKNQKPTKKTTDRVSMDTVRQQVIRSSNVVIETEENENENEEVASQEMDEVEDEPSDDEEGVSADKGQSPEDRVETAGEIAQVQLDHESKVQDVDEQRSDIVARQYPTNSRGRAIIPTTKDTLPINQSTTWRRKNW